jgi:Protein of unknown function (DUF5131)
MRRWAAWDWRANPVEPSTWTDAAERLVVLDVIGGPVGQVAAATLLEAVCRGAVAVMRCGAGDLASSDNWPANIIPAGHARTQAELDAVVTELLRVPSACRALWLEPTEEIDLSCAKCMDCAGEGEVNLNLSGQWVDCDECNGTGKPWSWVIVRGGNEPMHPSWVSRIRDDCAATGVPFCFLGWGEYIPISEAYPGHERFEHRFVWRWREGDPNHLPLSTYRVGAKLSGRELDGAEYDERHEAAR